MGAAGALVRRRNGGARYSSAFPAVPQLDGVAKQMKASKPTVNKQSQPARRLMQVRWGS